LASAGTGQLSAVQLISQLTQYPIRLDEPNGLGEMFGALSDFECTPQDPKERPPSGEEDRQFAG
jgi:hypothetical protein